MASLTRGYFRDHARPVKVNVAGLDAAAEPKEFKAGSLGWHYGGKITVLVAGVPVLCQVGVNLTVVDSKGLR